MCRATKLCCFKCLNWFEKSDNDMCTTCGDWKCPNCGGCLCNLSQKEQRIAIAYMATYENLLKELTNESYDFSRHRKILAKMGVKPAYLVRANVRS